MSHCKSNKILKNMTQKYKNSLHRHSQIFSSNRVVNTRNKMSVKIISAQILYTVKKKLWAAPKDESTQLPKTPR